MAIEVIDIIKQKNNGKFPVVDSNDVRGGFYQVDTISERDSIPQERRKDGMLCFVENDPSRNHTYQLLNGKWTLPNYVASNAVYIGDNTPSDNTVLWVDDKDEEVNNVLGDNTIVNEFAKTVKALDDKVKDIHYAFTKDLDAGEIPNPEDNVETRRVVKKKKKSRKFAFMDILGNEVDEETYDVGDGEEDGGISLPKYKKGNIEAIRIKRVSKKRYLPPFLKDGELIYCRDTKELLISDNGAYVTIGSSTGGGGGTGPNPDPNIPKEVITLTSPNSTKYDIRINNSGMLVVSRTDLEDVELPTVDQANRYKGLIVKHIYGGGLKDNNTAPVSHGFIELYNSTKVDLNLKGLSLQYAENGGEWKVLELKGEIPAFSSFLVRAQRHSNEALLTTRCKIREYDMSWDDLLMLDKGMKVALMVGIEPITVVNPFIEGTDTLPIPGYIDMLASGGLAVENIIDGYEKRFGHYMSKYHSVYKKECAGKWDIDDNMLNCEQLDFRTCDIKIYSPRHTGSGPWYPEFDKLKIDPKRPNLLTIAFGQEVTTRIFTWQAVPSRFGYLKYRKVGSDKFITVPSTYKRIAYEDADVNAHSVTIRNLEPGIYEYQAGEEGRWSDLNDFEVKLYEDQNSPIEFVQVSDQQGWDEFEYSAWKYCAEFIDKNENFDFIINTGDVAQNGNRAFEWRYYYEFGKQLTNTKMHMSCIGNNDRTDKVDSTPFTYYTDYENSPYISCYSYDVGPIHFISLNSEELNAEQQTWFKEDIAKTNKPWVIVYMHVSPYTIIQTAKVQDWRPVFEECGVDLVICGHNHAYSRSHPMKNEVVDEANGTYYVMCQATGFKLSGKEKPISPAPNYYAHVGYPAGPVYIKWEVTRDKIKMITYYVDGLMPLELYEGGPLSKQVYDTIEIPNRNLRG